MIVSESMVFKNSDEYRGKIHDLIPGGCHTYSKGDDQFPELSPAAISHGKGAYVWDIDGNEYLDCSMGLTSVSLGHAFDEVVDAVKSELDKGTNFQRPSSLEMEMAEKFLELTPSHDMIKFAKNGSSVTTAAVKLARAHTGRKYVAFPGDHPFYSYDDWFIGKTECSFGVPEEFSSLSLTFNSMDLTTLDALFEKYPGQIACVITEPEKNTMAPDNTYLRDVKEICHKNGALLISDEMVTGFKTSLPGTFVKNNVEADMATWGKGIANGFSFCALTGKKEVMELGGVRNEGKDKLFLISTTHGGETHALRAAIATIDIFKKESVVEHNHKMGKRTIEQCKSILSDSGLGEHVDIVECPWLPAFIFRDDSKNVSSPYRTFFLQEMIKNGILFQGILSPCFSHKENEIDRFSNAFEKSLKSYKEALAGNISDFLVGREIKPVFRKFI